QKVAVLNDQRLVEVVVVEPGLILGPMKSLAEQSVAWQPVDSKKDDRGNGDHGEGDQYEALADVDQRSSREHPDYKFWLKQEEGACTSQAPSGYNLTSAAGSSTDSTS